eukprot:5705151-Pyramimonas_sp.AAC.1
MELDVGSRNAVLGGGNACEHRYWGLRWSSLWDHETLCLAGGIHANTPTSWAGATYANTANGALTSVSYTHLTLPTILLV